MNKKIAFFDTQSYDSRAFKEANEKFSFPITYFETKLTKETVALTKDFPVICLFTHDFIDTSLMKALYNNGVRLIALRSNGYNNINLDPSGGKIRLIHIPQYSPHSVAEFTIALILALTRKLYLSFTRTRTDNFSLQGLEGTTLNGKTAGIIGAGQIGSIVVRLLTTFGMKVYVHDSFVNETLTKETKCIYTDLNTLYRKSDIISLHCPLTGKSHHMINNRAIKLMKDNVLIINTSRGGLIKTHDLIENLKSKKIAGAALDVYEEDEHFFFEDLSTCTSSEALLSRLLTFQNVIATAHQAYFTKEALDEIATITLSNINRFFIGEELEHEIRIKYTAARE
jgi:D-lactate dehydrogenase